MIGNGNGPNSQIKQEKENEVDQEDLELGEISTNNMEMKVIEQIIYRIGNCQNEGYKEVGFECLKGRRKM